MEDERENSAFTTNRRKKSSLSLISCFHGNSGRSDPREYGTVASPVRSPWFRACKGQESPDAKGRRRGKFMSKMHVGRHRRHASADFSYDPLSYALNFEQEVEQSAEFEDIPIRQFGARLPLPTEGWRVSENARKRPEVSVKKEPLGTDPAVVVVSSLPATGEEMRGVDRKKSRAAAVAEVRHNLEETTPSREILVGIY